MKKKLCMAVAAVLTCLLLSGCCVSHQWQGASCEAPKTCGKCGETEGEALGHDWKVSCEEPETCARCGETRGEAPGHSWAEATCEAPKTCTACGAVEGEALGHTVESGRFVEKQSAFFHIGTCSVCGEEFEEVMDDFASLAWGGWNVVSADGEALDNWMYIELREDGTACATQESGVTYGTWNCFAFADGDIIPEAGKEQIYHLQVEILLQGNTKLLGTIDGTDTSVMSLERYSGSGPQELQLHRGLTPEEQEAHDDIAAKEEALIGKWELRAMYADSALDPAENGVYMSFEFTEDGGATRFLSATDGEGTHTGTWESLGMQEDGAMVFQINLTGENGDAISGYLNMTFWEDTPFDGICGDLVDAGSVLVWQGRANFIFNKAE